MWSNCLILLQPGGLRWLAAGHRVIGRGIDSSESPLKGRTSPGPALGITSRNYRIQLPTCSREGTCWKGTHGILSKFPVGCISMGLPPIPVLVSRTHCYLRIFLKPTRTLLCPSIVSIVHSGRKKWLLPPNKVLYCFLALSPHTTVPSGIHPTWHRSEVVSLSHSVSEDSRWSGLHDF